MLNVHTSRKGVMHQGGERDKRVVCIKCMKVISPCSSQSRLEKPRCAPVRDGQSASLRHDFLLCKLKRGQKPGDPNYVAKFNNEDVQGKGAGWYVLRALGSSPDTT